MMNFRRWSFSSETLFPSELVFRRLLPVLDTEHPDKVGMIVDRVGWDWGLSL